MTRSRGKQKPNIRDLSRQWPTNEESDAMFASMDDDNSHPIVTAILGQVLVEHQLERLLRPRFRRNDDSTWARLTSEYGPLNTFGQKIIAGHALGLYEETLMDVLNSIKLIRNAFAHSKRPIDFSNELVGKELRSIPVPSGRRKLFVWLRRAKDDAKLSNRLAYVMLCYAVYIEIVKSGNKRLKAKNRRLRRQVQKASFFNYLAQIDPKESQGFRGGLFGGFAPAGPTSPRGFLSLLGDFLPPKSDDSTDKKD